MLLAAFGYNTYYNIDVVYPKKTYSEVKIKSKIKQFFNHEESKRTKKMKDMEQNKNQQQDPYMMLLSNQRKQLDKAKNNANKPEKQKVKPDRKR